MKNKIFTSTLLLIATMASTISYGQSIPGSAFPAAGAIFSLTLADTAGVQPGASGNGTTWNFASLTTHGLVQADTFFAPGSTPYGGVFPTASIAVHETSPGTNYYIYYQNDAAAGVYKRIGNVQPDTVIYSDPANQFPYPLSFGSVFNDTYYSKYHTTGGTAVMSGASSGSVDGTGTLTLPTGTYTGVVRSHDSRTEHDTTANGTAVVLTVDYYEWYQAQAYFPILSIVTTHIQGGPVNIFKKSVAYRAGYGGTGPGGIDDVNASIQNMVIYPNPSSQKATVLYDTKEKGETMITVNDLMGRTLTTQTESTVAGHHAAQIELTNLPSGIYIVNVSNGGAVKSLKLQVAE